MIARKTCDYMPQNENADAVPRFAVARMPIGSSMELKALRKDMSPLEESFTKRQIDIKILDSFKKKDEEWRTALAKLEAYRKEKNRISLEIVKNKGDEKLLDEAKAIEKSKAELEEAEKRISEERDNLLLNLPNLVNPLQPVDEAKTLAFVGVPKVDAKRVAEFKEQYQGVNYVEAKNTKKQYDIIKEYALVDEEKGADLAGARFYYKLNELTVLDLALSLHAIKILRKQGFTTITPPYLVKKYVEAMATTLDAFEEAIYKIEGEDLYLIPTAEHPIAAFNHGTTFAEKDLPLRYGGFSASFRKEAGAHGKDTKGIYRNHHFNKVEQYIICTPEQVEDGVNLVVQNQTQLIRSMDIPCRAILMPTWDMDKKAVFHIDVEGWFPGQNRYGELGSHASVGSWQAARLNMKYVPSGKEDSQYVHTIYGTMVPVERTLACMLENNLDDDGIIHIPKVLADLSGIDEIKPLPKNR